MLKPRGIVFDVQPLGDIGWITVIFGVSYDKLVESDAVFYGYFNILCRTPASAIRSCRDMQGRCAAFLTENDSRIANGGDGVVIGGPNCSEIRIRLRERSHACFARDIQRCDPEFPFSRHRANEAAERTEHRSSRKPAGSG